MEQMNEDYANEIIEYCAKNTEFTVAEVCKKYKISMDLAFYLIQEASKKI